MNTITLTFDVNGQNIENTSPKLCMASDTVNYVEATFHLGDNWDGFDSVRAVWSNGRDTYATVLDTDGTCKAPTELLTVKSVVKVNLVGSNVVEGELVDRLTTYQSVALNIAKKVPIEGEETDPVTPSQFEQYIAIVNAEVEKVTGMTAEATTLPAGSDATASYEDGVLSFGIPKGDTGATGPKGDPGQDGQDGVGIASTVLNDDYTLTITLTDGRTYTTTSIRGEQGETGLTPDFTIGTVTTLAPGSQATATITGTDEEPVLNLGIPKGDPGDVSSTGYYPDLYAGGLVTDKGETDTAPYTFRASKALGYRESLNQIVGGTVAWNQLVQNGNFANTNNWSGQHCSISASGNVLTAEATAESVAGRIEQAVTLIAGHKYLFKENIKVSADARSRFAYRYSGGVKYTASLNATANTWGELATVFSADTQGDSGMLYLYYSNSTALAVGGTAQYKNVMCIDLTLMFGSTIADYIYSLEQATAGAGVAFFKTLFPKPYYAYNAGELMSVKGLVSHDMVGFNAWDEEWEVGSINVDTGVNIVRDDMFRSKNYIPIVQGSSYYIQKKSTDTIGLRFYDANKNYIGSYGVVASTVLTYGTNSLPSNACYMRFVNTSTNIYNHDICINLSWDGSEDGNYEPYQKWSYPLDSDLELRGIPKIENGNLYYDGDVYEPNGTVNRRYGTITFDGSSDERWQIYTGTELNQLFIAVSGVAYRNNEILAISDRYVGISIAIRYNHYGTVYVYNGGIAFNVSGYDLSTWKTYLQSNPVTVVYELATPTTESADPYTQIQFCDPDGTEAFTDYGVESGDRDVAIPVGHSTFYPMDLKGKLEDIPEIPEAPASNGTYTLKAVRSNTGVIYSWVSG